MTKSQRLRRVALLCAHFARNLAYYRAGGSNVSKASPQFWITLQGNFVDVATLEWCKLLGDTRGRHFWKNVVTDKSRFEAELLAELAMTADEFSKLVDTIRTYRDKFVAHLDDLTTMNIPFLDRAHAAVNFYHRYIVQHEGASSDLTHLPTDLASYYDECYAEAISVYAGRPQP